MEISKFCYQCQKYSTDGFTNDMDEMEPDCFKFRKCGGCLFSERIEGRNGVIGCTKLNILRSADDVCV